MTSRFLPVVLGIGLAVIAGCFTSFRKVDRGTGGGGGTCEPLPGDCVNADLANVDFRGSGTVRITDMVRFGDRTRIVGVFTGRVTLGQAGQQEAEGSGDGFLLEVYDDGSLHRPLRVFEEADASSTLHIAQHLLDANFVVAGTYSEASATTCTNDGEQGLFVHFLRETEPPLYGFCIGVDPGTEFSINDMHFGETNFVGLVGDFRGTLSGTPSEGSSTDGYVLTIDPTGSTRPLLPIAGTGDASVRSIEENFVGENQWLVAGDFTGPMSIDIETLGEDSDAGEARHLFLASLDENPGNPNLELYVFDGMNAQHRLIDMELLGGPDPGAIDGAVLLAETNGELIVDGVRIPASDGPAAVAFSIDVPSGDGMPDLRWREHYVFRAEALDLRGVQARIDRFAIGGSARGEVTIDRRSTTDEPNWATIPGDSCAASTLLVDIDPVAEANTSQRCGGPHTMVTAMSEAVDGGILAAIAIGDGSILFGGSPSQGPDAVLVQIPAQD